MSEQAPQNQNIPNEQEMRARDDAIFDTVAEFRNELDNPAEHTKVPEFSDMGADDADHKVDVDAIFDNRKAEITPLSTGRHRKAYSEEADKAAGKASMQYRAKRVADQMSEGVAMDQLQGMATHRGNEEFAAVAMAKKSKKGELPKELQDAEEGEDSVFDPAALAAAERAIRTDPNARAISGYGEQSTGTSSSAPEASASATSNDQSRTTMRNGRPVRAVPSGVAGSHSNDYGMTPTGRHLIAPSGEGAPTPDNHVISPDGRLLGDDGRMGSRPEDTEPIPLRAQSADAEGYPRYGIPASEARFAPDFADTDDDNETVPVTVTPEARRRNRVAGKLAMIAAGVRSTAGELKDFMVGGTNYARDLMYRTPEGDLNDTERKARPYVRAMGVAAGAAAVAIAALSGSHLVANASEHAPGTAEPSVSASANPGETQYGPQVPKTSETPSPSASTSKEATPTETPSATPDATKTPKAKPSAPVAGPSAIPSTPNNTWANKPPVPEPESAPTTQERTVHAGNENLSFSADGKEVTVTLGQNGNFWNGVHDAEREMNVDSSDSATAEAVQSMHLKAGEANQMPVGANITFKLQDGKLVAQ